MNTYKVVKEFVGENNKRILTHSIVIEPTANVIKFGRVRVGDTQELLSQGFIVKLDTSKDTEWR